MMKNSVFVGLGMAALLASPVFSQQEGQPAARSTRQQSIQRIADKLSEQAGVKILVSSALSQQLTVAPETAPTSDNLEDLLDKLVRRVAESAWAKVYLPAPAKGKRYTADAVAQYSQAQTGLFGRQVKSEPGTVELLGKRMTMAQAQPFIKGLGLEVYYVLISRRAPLGMMAGGLPTTGGNNTNALMDNLMKQLGVSSPKDIPTGDYDVTIPGADGTPQKARISVKNGDGSMSIAVRVGGG